MAGLKFTKIKTPTYIKATFKKEQRIKIPQSTAKQVTLHKADTVRWAELKEHNGDDYDFATHRRGLSRPQVGVDQLEARAVSKNSLRGYLPERVVYKWLVVSGHMVSGWDFTFQSSQEGGRQELGGAVVDFLFPFKKLILQVDGPTHDQFLRKLKDEEQAQWLVDMGYTIYHITMEDIYDVFLFEEKMRRLFGFAQGYGGSTAAWGPSEANDANEFDEEVADRLLGIAAQIFVNLVAANV
jgi:very-short-patch-repair endonuclease